MAAKYKFFPKLIVTLLILTIIILFIRRVEYGEKLEELIGEAVDTVVVDSIDQIPEEDIVEESKDLSSGLVAFYSFGGDANDNSRKKNDGEIFGAEFTTDRFNLPYNAFRFDGNGTYIKLPQTDHLKSMNKELTATAWVFPEKYEGSRGIVAWDGHWSLVLDKLGAVGKVFRYPSGSKTAFSNRQIALNKWSFVALTYDGQEIMVYTNGLLTGNQPFATDSLGARGYRLYSQPTIGHGVGVYPQYFIGKIDEIYLYNRALNRTEIKAIFDSQKPRGY